MCCIAGCMAVTLYITVMYALDWHRQHFMHATIEIPAALASQVVHLELAAAAAASAASVVLPTLPVLVPSQAATQILLQHHPAAAVVAMAIVPAANCKMSQLEAPRAGRPARDHRTRHRSPGSLNWLPLTKIFDPKRAGTGISALR